MSKEKIALHRKFNTVQDFIDRIKLPSNVPEGRMASLKNNSSESWDLNTNLNKALEYIESGWQEGADKISDVNSTMTQTGAGYIDLPSFEPSEIGEIVEPGAYFAGEPECFYLQQPIEKKVPVVKIGIPISISCDASAEKIMNRGITLLSLINAIEQNRINTDVWAIEYTSNHSDKHFLYEVRVKAPDEPFDIDKLAFICAHPAFLRRVIFAINERESPEHVSMFNFGGGYGSPATFTSKEYDLLPDYNLSRFRSKETAREWLIENAKKVGFQIEFTS